ncbi:MAG TPA: PDZ domain-containing protein [Candidatus Binataceae bacterium]|nr:PDZ domain-containing protein [Candidatus Binataceae bacterium]
MSSAGASTRRERARRIRGARLIGVTCAVAIVAATSGVRICAAGDDSGAALASAIPSPAGSAASPASAHAPVAAASPAAEVPDHDAVPSTTVEIAPALIAPQAAQQQQPDASQSPGEDLSNFADTPEIRDYEQHQEDPPPAGAPGPAGMNAMQGYLSADAITSPIGIEIREARRTLKSGEEADGLLVVGVAKGSPAAAAGLHAYSRGIHNALTGAMIVAGLIFPPAILGVPLLDYTEVGESYDMIIGVDGARVATFLDFEDRMRDLRPGEIVYLSVVRDGRRLQFRVDFPVGATLATY